MVIYDLPTGESEPHVVNLQSILDAALALPGVQGGAIVDMETGLEMARRGLAESDSVSIMRARGAAIRNLLQSGIRFGTSPSARFMLLSRGNAYQVIFTVNQTEGDEGLFVHLVLSPETRLIPAILAWVRDRARHTVSMTA